MKLISRFEAAALSSAQLHRTRREAFDVIASQKHNQRALRAALATMRVVENELSKRSLAP
ncbi:hypothetical protein [uncultured Roseobacter sp.]|uniref:hypothetical protein n=1 Tax=uncultured Roseobacter sp. TaxID=114847 RepID=UPI002615095E|nr:hypothetical protein [uncultured Roseobacter sp.]